jgi:hypothetical protein
LHLRALPNEQLILKEVAQFVKQEADRGLAYPQSPRDGCHAALLGERTSRLRADEDNSLAVNGNAAVRERPSFRHAHGKLAQDQANHSKMYKVISR